MTGLSFAGAVAIALTLSAPRPFDTAATFTLDGTVMRLRSAVAIASAHPTATGYSTVEIDFYAFPLTGDQIDAVSSTGRLDALERRRRDRRPGDPDFNHSHAALDLLFDRQQQLTNASLALPGLTCTIVVDPSTTADAIQRIEHDAAHVRVRAKGARTCDLAAVGGAAHPVAWDVDVTLPLFVKKR